MTKEELIEHYQMLPHPEGGYYKETYRSEIDFDTKRGKRSASTAIHFLITQDSISHLHRLTSDEGWHFHLGDPLKILEITPEGKLIETTLGTDFKAGHKLQHIVPAGHWFGSTSTGEYSFVGCTVSPGFDFEDFEMGNKEALSSEFPHLKELIEKYSLE